MTVVVTGAAGHIGCNLVRALLERGRQVRALVHRDRRALEGLQLEVISGDVRRQEDLERAFAGAEHVYHCASVISVDGDLDGLVTEVNVVGARNVAEMALRCGVRRLVHFSSIHAFDVDQLDGPIDEDTPRARPDQPAYNRSKAAGEAALREVIGAGLDAVVINPTAVLGRNDFGPSHQGQLFLDLFHGKLPLLVEGGFDWVDVRDVVDTALAAAERGRSGESYLAAGHYHTVMELAAMAQQVCGRAMPRHAAPQWLARIGAPFMTLGNRLFGIRALYTPESLRSLRANPEISSAKARAELGHHPRPLLETVEDMYRSFAERGLVELDL